MCIFFSISLSPTTSISNAYRVLTRFVFTVSPLHLFRAPLTTTKFAQQLLAHVWQQNDKPAVTGRWVQQQQQQSAEAQKTVKETPQKKKKTVSSDTHSSARTGRRNLFGFFFGSFSVIYFRSRSPDSTEHKSAFGNRKLRLCCRVVSCLINHHNAVGGSEWVWVFWVYF